MKREMFLSHHNCLLYLMDLYYSEIEDYLFKYSDFPCKFVKRFRLLSSGFYIMNLVKQLLIIIYDYFSYLGYLFLVSGSS